MFTVGDDTPELSPGMDSTTSTTLDFLTGRDTLYADSSRVLPFLTLSTVFSKGII